MDFHGLQRKDLQFFCKRNKIPANMTNIAMADALKALEIVEGIDEFVNQSESTCDQSPTSVAKNLPGASRTAARTTRRKTKDETQSSELVTRSCLVTSKTQPGELDQENKNTNLLQNPSVPQSRRRAAATSVAIDLEATELKPETNVSKTPAARSTRRAQAVASSKKDESAQRVYSTRRSVKLLEESMADLSLKTKKSLNVPAKKTEDAAREDSPAGSKSQEESEDNLEETEEAEVISVRDLNASLDKVWDGSKNDPDLGDITFFDANTSEEQMNGIESNNFPASDSFVTVEEQETSQEDDFVVVDHAAFTATNIVAYNKESESEQMKKSASKLALVADSKEEENVDDDMALNNTEESKAEAEDKKKKKKTIDEESLKDVSVRQLTKMVKELAIKSKQQHKCVE